MTKKHRLWYIAQAKALYQNYGEVEVDDNATVSMGAEDGAYVQAWVWVYDPDAYAEEDHWSTENGCLEDCPACKEEIEAELRRREP